MFNKIDTEYNGGVLDPKASKVLVVLAVGALLYTLVLMLLNYDAHSEGLRLYVAENLAVSGVTNPITAVLLNFRAYDTLLEIAVLLVVVIAVLPARNHDAPLVQYVKNARADLALLALQRWVAPALILFAGYLLWAGAFKPGGAFQAGALLAASCVLMFQTGQYRTNYTSMFARWLLAFGLLVFVVTGTALMVFATGLLSYPAGWAPTLILIIEGAATVSIALSLASLYSSLAEPPYPSLDRSRGGV